MLKETLTDTSVNNSIFGNISNGITSNYDPTATINALATNNYNNFITPDWLQGTLPTTDSDISKMHDLSYTVPVSAEPLKTTIFPYTTPSVFKKDGVYFLQRNKGYDILEKKTRIFTTEVTNLMFIDPVITKDFLETADTVSRGIQPSQLLISMIDYFSSKETNSIQEVQTIKHLQYALAYIDQEILTNINEPK